MIAKQLSKISPFVLYMVGEGNYTHIHFVSKRPELYATNLGTFEKDLPDFVRIHKSYLINPAHVTDYRTRGHRTSEVRVGEHWLPIGRRRIDEVETVLKQLEEIA